MRTQAGGSIMPSSPKRPTIRDAATSVAYIFGYPVFVTLPARGRGIRMANARTLPGDSLRSVRPSLPAGARSLYFVNGFVDLLFIGGFSILTDRKSTRL